MHPGQSLELAIITKHDGVAKQMAWEITVNGVCRIELPVSRRDPLHISYALQTLWLEEGFVEHPKVFVPQGFAEAVDLPPRCLGVATKMSRLVSTNGNLGVPRPIHRPLIDVGGSDDYVFIIN